MYYEINVSKRDNPNTHLGKLGYSHYFATAPRSLTDRESAINMVKVFQEKFPEPEYQISVSYDPEEGIYYPTPEDFLNHGE